MFSHSARVWGRVRESQQGAGSGSVDQLPVGRMPLGVFSVDEYAFRESTRQLGLPSIIRGTGGVESTGSCPRLER